MQKTTSLAPVSRSTPAILFESTTERLVDVTRQLIREAARSGNAVIFRHGAQFILAEQPGTLHVRFVAPLPVRIDRVMHRYAISRAEAERRVRTEDQRRTALG